MTTAITHRLSLTAIIVTGAALLLLAAPTTAVAQEGACCLPDYSCSGQETEATCTAASGTWNADLQCFEVDCSPPLGACCKQDDTCEEMDQSICNNWSGTWNSGLQCNEISCVPLGACCDSQSNSCSQWPQASCTGQYETYLGDGTTCSAGVCPGGCCFGDASCQNLTSAACTTAGGTPEVEFAACGEWACELAVGACCTEVGNCETIDQGVCELAFGGTWAGAGTSCASYTCPALPTGSCCNTFPNGVVFCEPNTTAFECSQLNGIYNGDGSVCIDNVLPCAHPTGACCEGPGGGTCGVKTEAECGLNFWYGPNSTCSPTNPCSAGTGACCYGASGGIMPQAPCEDWGGTYLGDGVPANACDRPCCFNDMSCQVLSSAACSAAGGQISTTNATTCSGQACGECSVPAPPGSSGCCLNEFIIAIAESACDLQWAGCKAFCFWDGSCLDSCDASRLSCRAGVPACNECPDVGQPCTPIGKGCREPFDCHPLEPFAWKCGMPNNDTPLTRDICKIGYSPTQCLAGLALGSSLSYVEAIGADAGAGVTGEIEIGQVYSRDGKYGCYSAQCQGVGFVLAAGVSRSYGGLSVDWSGIAGRADFQCVGGDTPAINVGAETCSFYIDAAGKTCTTPADLFPTPNGDCAYIGQTAGVGFGVGLGAASVAFGECDTAAIEVGTFSSDCLTLTETNPATNQPPTCNAGGPYYTESCDGTTANVTLDGSGSTDPNVTDTLTYEWSSNCPSASFSSTSAWGPAMSFGAVCNGNCLARLKVSDGTYTSSCCASVGVNDGAPTITCPADTSVACGGDTSIGTTGNANATDTCSGTVTITSQDSSAPTCGSSFTRTFSATDDCTQSSQCDQIITVQSAEADLGITKDDGQTSISQGQLVTYTIIATNAGPYDATGATVTDYFPAGLSGVTWSCTAAGGASCTSSGSGNIIDTVNLPVGSSVTYVAVATATTVGDLTNNTTVAVPGGMIDSNQANNTTSDTTTVVAGVVTGDLLFVGSSTYSGKGWRVQADGGGLAEIITPFEITAVVADLVGGTLYWAERPWDGSPGRILRSALDGSASEIIVVGLSWPSDLELDVGAGKIYWTERSGGAVKRADLSGNNLQVLVTGLTSPTGLGLDLEAGTMYFVENNVTVKRSLLDGSGAATVLTSSSLNDVEVDTTNDRIYLSSGSSAVGLLRAELNGANPTTLVAAALGTGVEVRGASLFFKMGATSALTQSDLDGGNATAVLPAGTPYIGYWDVDVGQSKAFAIGSDYHLRRFDLDPGTPNPVFLSHAITTGGHDLAVDAAAGKVYFFDESTGSLLQANLDGSGVTAVLVDMPRSGEYPRGITLDPAASRLYWAHGDSSGKISAVNTDGSGLVDLATGLQVPHDVVLDVANGHLYFTEGASSKSSRAVPAIRRVDIGGGVPVDIVTGLGVGLRGLDLDLTAGKLYWTDHTSDTVSRADLTGSNQEVILSGLTNPHDVAVDAAGGKLYWIEGISGSNGSNALIRRANLDGTIPEDVITGLDNYSRDLNFVAIPNGIFTDGFESGGTTAWSTSVP